MRISQFFVLAPIVCAVAMAQESRGTITGTVADPQGAAIPGAAVAARNLGTNSEAKTTTNESGVYVLPFLNTGTYTVTATVAGFKSAVRDRVDVGLNQRLQLDFKMEVGGITEQVTVSAQAELLNTANASRGTTIDAQKVADLPLLGKNPYTFAYHAAGVLHINPQGSITDRPYDNGGMDYLSIAGGRPFTNEFLLDGAPNTNTERNNVGSLSFVPPPEATEEVAVLNNNYDAQFGRTGGGVVQATLKSGTNKLHGASLRIPPQPGSERQYLECQPGRPASRTIHLESAGRDGERAGLHSQDLRWPQQDVFPVLVGSHQAEHPQCQSGYRSNGGESGRRLLLPAPDQWLTHHHLRSADHGAGREREHTRCRSLVIKSRRTGSIRSP